MQLGRIGEKKLIENIWKIIGEKSEDEDVHFFDDGNEYLLLALDTINEGFHFEKWWDPKLIGKFLVDINLSDIASKNGKPLELMVSFSLPRSLDDAWVKLLMEGIREETERYRIKFSGGDLKESKKISLTGLIMGRVKKGEEFRRSGARPGDFVYITEILGRNERAIIDYYKGDKNKFKDILRIKPRFDVLETLKKLHTTSCMDNSDGIYKSLSSLSKLSGVKIKIENDKSGSFRNEEDMACIFGTGGDYELIFTSPDISDEFPRIGTVLEGKGVINVDGTSEIPSGYDHFRTRHGTV